MRCAPVLFSLYRSSAHVPVFCSCADLLLMCRSSAHVPVFCSCADLLLTCRYSAHVPVFCSCAGLLLMCRSSAHVPVFCSCAGLLLMCLSSAHVPVFCSCAGLLLTVPVLFTQLTLFCDVRLSCTGLDLPCGVWTFHTDRTTPAGGGGRHGNDALQMFGYLSHTCLLTYCSGHLSVDTL